MWSDDQICQIHDGTALIHWAVKYILAVAASHTFYCIYILVSLWIENTVQTS